MMRDFAVAHQLTNLTKTDDDIVVDFDVVGVRTTLGYETQSTRVVENHRSETSYH